MIKLVKVNQSNFEQILAMKVTDEQKEFVAPNIESLAEAWLYYEQARPYAVLKDETPIGFLMLDWDIEERTAAVWRFMIAPEHQNKGYGREVLSIAIELAKNSPDIDLLTLDYVPSNAIGRKLYYSMGFRENGKEDCGEIIMTMKVKDTPRLGMLTADIDDLDEIFELLQQNGSPFIELGDKQQLSVELDNKLITRFCIYGETVGVGYKGKIVLDKEYVQYAAEASAKLKAKKEK